MFLKFLDNKRNSKCKWPLQDLWNKSGLLEEQVTDLRDNNCLPPHRMCAAISPGMSCLSTLHTQPLSPLQPTEVALQWVQLTHLKDKIHLWVQMPTTWWDCTRWCNKGTNVTHSSGSVLLDVCPPDVTDQCWWSGLEVFM